LIEFPAPAVEYGEVCFSPDGRLLASGCRDDFAIRIWEAETGECLRVLAAQQEEASLS
jgi:WD40 repeat protein